MCMIDDSDETQCWNEVHRRARKDHHCEECGRQIARGETYWHSSGVTDHRGWDVKTCEHCHVISNWLTVNCSGFIHGDQVEDFSNHSEANFPMLRIVVGARRQWRAFADPSVLLPIPTYPPDMI